MTKGTNEGLPSALRRAPTQPLIQFPPTLSELTGPGPLLSAITPAEADLTSNAGAGGKPIGQRMILTGRVLDEFGRPVRNTLIEVWQANASGRYSHDLDRASGVLDPNFNGIGRCLTDADGCYRFLTIRPGAYPMQDRPSVWRPAHIHVSLFGPSWRTRFVTQMYFVGDPLLAFDPVFNSVPGEEARRRVIAEYAHDLTEPDWALAWRWNIVLRGSQATPFEGDDKVTR